MEERDQRQHRDINGSLDRGSYTGVQVRQSPGRTREQSSLLRRGDYRLFGELTSGGIRVTRDIETLPWNGLDGHVREAGTSQAGNIENKRRSHLQWSDHTPIVSVGFPLHSHLDF